jgi:hypothetical protein
MLLETMLAGHCLSNGNGRDMREAKKLRKKPPLENRPLLKEIPAQR